MPSLLNDAKHEFYWLYCSQLPGNWPYSDVALLMVDVIHIQYIYVQYAIHVHRMCCAVTVNSVNLAVLSFAWRGRVLGM